LTLEDGTDRLARTVRKLGRITSKKIKGLVLICCGLLEIRWLPDVKVYRLLSDARQNVVTSLLAFFVLYGNLNVISCK